MTLVDKNLKELHAGDKVYCPNIANSVFDVLEVTRDWIRIKAKGPVLTIRTRMKLYGDTYMIEQLIGVVQNDSCSSRES